MTDDQAQKPKYHSKSEMRRIEHMKESKPDAQVREDGIVIYDNQKWIRKIQYDALKDERDAARRDHDQDILNLADAKEREQRLVAALEKIIAHSHSWVVTQETGAIQKPIHDGYRAIAEEALKANKGGA